MNIMCYVDQVLCFCCAVILLGIVINKQTTSHDKKFIVS